MERIEEEQDVGGRGTVGEGRVWWRVKEVRVWREEGRNRVEVWREGWMTEKARDQCHYYCKEPF